MRDPISQLRSLSPGWWGAVAGAAAAGATIVPGHRFLAAAIGGVALLAVALSQAAPCACHGEAPPVVPDLQVAAAPEETRWDLLEKYAGDVLPGAANEIGQAPGKGCGCK
jgi:hypothetical protein